MKHLFLCSGCWHLGLNKVKGQYQMFTFVPNEKRDFGTILRPPDKNL